MQEAQCGTQFQDSRITPWAKGRDQTTEPPTDPQLSPVLRTGPTSEVHVTVHSLLHITEGLQSRAWDKALWVIYLLKDVKQENCSHCNLRAGMMYLITSHSSLMIIDRATDNTSKSVLS